MPGKTAGEFNGAICCACTSKNACSAIIIAMTSFTGCYYEVEKIRLTSFATWRKQTCKANHPFVQT